ncbi:S-layer homology domain-containing protein [Alteribacillus persepolensis]|uniref:S-layer homology domain-containing protein n=1 Tax=Alteribacillus persepolensis TaxID=568899 RepID=A0A1G8AFA4_9BACI|nr:S-layer homology domain-containing protein [Alteribacillus persepolensis]SDH19000.1 S-layer homology domain-containing protein [Alteribacillus persepolensis]
MRHRLKGVLFGGVLLAAAVLTGGCSDGEAGADSSQEAASAEWTEEQIASTEDKVTDADERLDELEQKIQSLQGEPLFPEEPVFPDVSADYHAFDEIQYLSAEDVISGFSDGYFRPSQEITRSQTAKMLTAALDLSAPDDYELQVTDVSAENHAYDELAAMEYHGIMTGNNGRMMPSEGLKRSQMAIVLVKAFDIAEADTIHTFTDIDEDYPNFEEINRIADHNITTEAGEAFRPNETTSRAQFSLFMARVLDDYFKN